MLRPSSRTLELTLLAAFIASACTGTAPPGASIAPTRAASAAAKTAAPTSDLGTARRPLVMAFVPSRDTARITASGTAITASLEQATGLKWDVTVPISDAAVAEGLCSRQIDVAWLDSLGYVLAHQKNCADLLLAWVRNDDTGAPSTTYRSQIIVRVDSGIDSIADLKGKRVAFGDPASASGTLFAALKIERETGQDPRTFFSRTIYAGRDDKAIVALMTGQVEAAASVIDARALVKTRFPDVMEATKRIATAGPIPNDTVSARSSLPADLKTKIQTWLLDYAGTDDGKKALKSLYGIDGLDTADPKAYEPIGEAVRSAGLDLETEARSTAKP